MIRSLRRADALSGTVVLPGDKSISHRYAMLAAIAEGPSEIRHFASSQDCHSTLRCLRGLGVASALDGETVRIEGRGLRGLTEPSSPLDAGNSGTTIRLLSGILAGHAFESVIGGDASLSRRPMRRIIEPLLRMGAAVDAREGEYPPLRIRGGQLRAVDYRLPVASAQVKSCVLLAGLYGDGPTAVVEPAPTRDHSEIALAAFGAKIERDGSRIRVEPGPRLRGRRLQVPGDLSGAAFFLVAGALVPGSDILMPATGLNPTRRELVRYFESSGFAVEVAGEWQDSGETRGDLRVRHSAEALERAKLLPIRGDLVPALIDEIPALAVLGSQTADGLEIGDARELRVKESDRIAAIAANLGAMGADVLEKPDGLVVSGRSRLRGADIRTRGDHRIAMAFAVAALVAEGETRIHEAECADVSFPGFYEALARVSQP